MASTVKSDIEPGITIQADAALLQRAIHNLFTNAVKYNRDGGEVKCTLAKKDGVIELTVANTGAPIFFTTLTTALGLLSFRFASLEAVRDLGTYGALGVVSAWPPGVPESARPNRSLLTEPSIWMLLKRLLRPAKLIA